MISVTLRLTDHETRGPRRLLQIAMDAHTHDRLEAEHLVTSAFDLFDGMQQVLPVAEPEQKEDDDYQE